MSNSHSLWVEKYRQTDLSTYIGNEHMKTKVHKYIESQDVPHLLLYGKAGTGKTTLAKLIVNNIECDYLTPNAQAALRNLMETFSKHCRFILTCNYVERIIDPIQSRCQPYKIVPPSRKDVAKQMVNILNEEGATYDLDDVALIVNAGYPDIRRVINSAQRQVVDGKLKVDVNSVIQSDYKIKLLESLTPNSKIAGIRQLLADNSVTDYAELYRLLYDEIDTYSNGKVAECILAIAEGQYQDIQVVDKEINFISTIVKLLRIIGSR